MTAPSMKYNPAFLDDEALIASFVSRHVELDLILETIHENTGGSNQHVLLIGPRGIGKTTLALRVAAEIHAVDDLQAQWYPLTFGEESYGVSTPGEFWLEALFHLGQQTQDERWHRAYEELRTERDEDRLRQRALVQLMDFADAHDKRLLLIVENLNMLVGSQMNSDDAWTLRHTLMNEPRLMLLGTATSRFKEIEEYGQALYDLFRVIELDPLDDEGARALWASVAGSEPTPAQIRPIQILTGGNPRLIRIISEFAADVSFQDLLTDLIRLVDEHTEYFKHHLDRLPATERKVFVALADRWDPSTAREVAEHARLDVNRTSALLRRLSDRGAVTVPYKRGRAKYYQLAERMYNVYHLMRRRGRTSNRVRAAVHFMTHLYRGERLVKTTRSLLEEARDLSPDEREDHLLAYQHILKETDETALRNQLIEVGEPYLSDMPDVPLSVHEMMASSEEKSGEPQTSEEEKARLLEMRVEEVDDTNTLLRMAQALSERSDRLEEAEAVYRKILQKEPENATALGRFGVLLNRQNQHNEAHKIFETLLLLDPENASAQLNRATALHQLERHEEALEAYELVLNLNENDSIALYNMALLLDHLERYEEALKAYKEVLSIHDNDVFAWYNKGIALYNLKYYDQALKTFERAIAELNNSPSLLNEVGSLFYKNKWQKHFPQAEDWARRAVKQEPENGYHRHTLAALLGAQDKWQEALSHADDFLSDTEMVESNLDTVIDFFVDAAAAGRGDEALEQIRASPSAELLEPLVVALRLRQGEEVDVAREIYEVAHDVVDRIEARREEMSQEGASGEKVTADG